jgi:hypothetical protein
MGIGIGDWEVWEDGGDKGDKGDKEEYLLLNY